MKEEPGELQFMDLTFEQVADPVLWVDSRARICRANQAACHSFGFSRQELLILKVHDITPDYRDKMWSEFWAKVKQDKVITVYSQHRRKGGELFHCEDTNYFVEINGEEYICSFIRDITARKAVEEELKRAYDQVEDALEKSKERFRNIFSHSNDAIFIVDPNEDKIIDANPMACKMLGFSRGELLSTPMSFIHPNEMPQFLAFVESVYQKERGWTNELTCLTKAGTSLPSEISASAIDIDGRSCIVAMVRDISKRKEAERALQEANEMLEERVGQRTVELKRALAEVESLKNKLQAENVYLQEEIKIEHNFEEIITQSKKLKDVLRKVEQVACTDATVLILGETGTGKELIARAVHNSCSRKDRPLVKVSCAALPINLIESELFGHEKGAFTGAINRKIGRFELAHGGSIFLDEIGDLHLELQAKLLRVLQEGEFERLGDTKTIHVNVRVITATNRDLEKAIENGSFREDLYYRLNVFPITIPPLRERLEDIPILTKHFTNKFSAKIGKRIDSISRNVMATLQTYTWPGNIRELENVIERAVILTQSNQLELGDWLPARQSKSIAELPQSLEKLEHKHIVEVLKKTGWRVSGNNGAAKILGLKPTTLEARMKKLGIKREI